MAPSATQTLLSPAELSYIHHSLSLSPPIRPDGRSPTEFRPLFAETDILPNTNGSARVCFADGSEAIAGVKAEVERSIARPGLDISADDDGEEERHGENAWVEMSIEIPGHRDDDALPVFLAAMLTEALLADSELKDRLWINRRFHWKLYIDILLLSPPSSYPLPLLSLTTHLSLLSTHLPALISDPADDPLFNDDWHSATPLYPPSSSTPPVTLLVTTIGETILLDPTPEELAVADAVLALSVAAPLPSKAKKGKGNPQARLLAIRTLDPPSRLTPLGTTAGPTEGAPPRTGMAWAPPQGGLKRELLSRVIKAVVAPGGGAEEVLAGLAGVVA
ncbi:hypothetical protein EJ06DRAFT_581422 [Trichodelitschia bisporula]|uniref:Ribosomal RNA-processing protein 42 n=1 Tax=Trichodelitschia bisporula TaxID=703511 RepID=A0A6G1HZI8_9PEZI|nr:hypothetical protein EJ06DRAFT_581422 [Trichodelitschia bisporula]